MSMNFTYKFYVWAGHEVREPILAFLRTSEFGEWKVDLEKENDALMMNLKRGNWGFGKRFARFIRDAEDRFKGPTRTSASGN